MDFIKKKNLLKVHGKTIYLKYNNIKLAYEIKNKAL